LGDHPRPCSNLKDGIQKIDAVIGTYSTLLYDVIAFGKPVLIAQTSLDYGEGMVRNDLAVLVREPNELLDAVQHAVGSAQEKTPAIQEKLYAGTGNLHDALEALIERDEQEKE